MRWDLGDCGIGQIAVAVAMLLCLPRVPSPDTPRAEVEKSLGQPSDTATNSYCISIRNPEWVREQTQDAIHAESCRYSHPLGTINVEYRGYRKQRVKSADFVHLLSLAGIAYLLAVPLVFAIGAELSRFVRRKFAIAPTPLPPTA